MDNKISSQQVLIGGICGIIGTVSYITVISFQFPPTIVFLLGLIWPILSIIFAFVVYKYIAIQKQSLSNQLAFLFTSIAFTLVSIMISIQLAARTGMEETLANAQGNEKDMLILFNDSMRWIDLGIDLAWDMFLGLALIFLSLAIKGHPRFGIWWSIPAALLGIAVLVLNLITFPHPPDTKGIIDIGPFVGTFMIIFAIRIVILGIKMKKSPINEAASE